MPAESARRPVVMLSAGEASGDLHGGALAAALRRLVLAVLPFERALYRQAKVPVEFVGHPIADALVGAPSRADARRRLGLGDGDLVIGLLPGSRPQEIARLTPIIRDAAATLASRHPNARFVLALAPTVSAADVTAHLGAGPRIDLVSDAHAVMRASDLLLATSGTATLEAALLGTPMVVIYRLSWLSQAVGHAVLRIPWVSLPNIILGRGVIPELFLRREATAERLAASAIELIETPRAR